MRKDDTETECSKQNINQYFVKKEGSNHKNVHLPEKKNEANANATLVYRSQDEQKLPNKMIRHLEGFLFKHISSLNKIESIIEEKNRLKEENIHLKGKNTQLVEENDKLKQDYDQVKQENSLLKQNFEFLFQNIKTKDESCDFLLPLKKRRKEPLLQDDCNLDDLQKQAEGIYYNSDDDAASKDSFSSETMTENQPLPLQLIVGDQSSDNRSFVSPVQEEEEEEEEEMAVANPSQKISKPADVTPNKAPSSFQERKCQHEEDIVHIVTPRRSLRQKQKNENIMFQRRIRQENDDNIPSGQLILSEKSNEMDTFQELIRKKSIKLYRIRMFRHDAICRTDPEGNKPSRWGIQHGYIACEARMLPPNVNTPQEVSKFCSSTFPVNATSASCAKEEMARLFSGSESWSDIDFDKSGIHYCTGYMHFMHNMRKGDVVALQLRGPKSEKLKFGKFYFGILQDDDVHVHHVKNDHWFLSKQFPSPQIFEKTIFRCGRILLRKVKWYRWAFARDLPGQSETVKGSNHVKWLLETGAITWIADCSNYSGLEHLRSNHFLNISHKI